MAPDIAGRVLSASSRPLGERIWRLPRRLHPLDSTICAVCTSHLQEVDVNPIMPLKGCANYTMEIEQSSEYSVTIDYEATACKCSIYCGLLHIALSCIVFLWLLT
jgi:hypothetical protein